MRLLKARALELEDGFYENNTPNAEAVNKLGYAKIERTCERALADGLEYVWIDTCCIDKTSSAELSEAINSMLRWYHNAVCYAYLSDVENFTSRDSPGQFLNSRWFKRGWTLQELIAPRELVFLSSDWQNSADIVSMLDQASIAGRMSWASARDTSRVEDMALLSDLQAALRALENLNLSIAEPDVTNLVEQIGDLIVIVITLQTKVLQALSTAIDLLYHQHDTNEGDQSLETRSPTSTQLHFQIGLVEQLLGHDQPHDTGTVQNALRAARAVTLYIPAIPNKHFVIPRPVKAYFTGRERQLTKLETAFRNTTSSAQQRFVIYGLRRPFQPRICGNGAFRGRPGTSGASPGVAGWLGADHPIAIWLSLFLTKTMWEMSEVDSATRQQRKALALCIKSLGEGHPLTLDVADLLGSALFLKGRWAEATALHAGNVEKMTKLYGEKHEKTLRSIRNMGRLHYRYMDYEKASGLCQTAWEGMREILGETHLETLVSLEDLAMSYLRYEDDAADPHQEESLAESYKRMAFVYEQRKERLGPEHPYTLLAILYFARLKSALGQHQEADTMIRDGLKIAERNFGKYHIALLMVKTIHAEVLTRLGRFVEAESIFYELIDKKPYSRLVDADNDHPDRLTNLWLMSKCLEEQGKLQEALKICEEFLTGLATIGGNGLGMRHKILPKMQERIARFQEAVRQAGNDVELSDERLGEN
ncbi:hypothetical protein B7463_g12601, partial [Scytalidium lignicola]